ncbi:MAG: ROK family protein [Enterococcus sp.]|nr:ROK family protein [Enterococcus sp.]
MNKNLGVIDIGGTTIKFALWKNGELFPGEVCKTPADLDTFYQIIERQIQIMTKQCSLSGIAISSPGAVNKASGVIEGASAIPYIHHFPIQQALEERLQLPVSIENDANCAALAEMEEGAGKNSNSLIFLVIGTGVGGSVIIDRQIWHGAHLFGGEFGFMLAEDNLTISNVLSPVSMAQRYNKKSKQILTGEQIFEQSKLGDEEAEKEVERFFGCLSKTIYNLQYSFDPEKIIIGGAVSNNLDLLPRVNEQIQELRKKVGIASITPAVAVCEYRGAANLRGAVVDFTQSFSEGD